MHTLVGTRQNTFDKSFHVTKNQYPFSFSSRLIVLKVWHSWRSLYCIIMLFLNHRYGWYIMWFCVVNPYNDKGVRYLYYNLLWYNCKHISYLFVRRRRKANTMARRKWTIGQTTIYKPYAKSERSSNSNPSKTRGWIDVLRKCEQFFLH